MYLTHNLTNMQTFKTILQETMYSLRSFNNMAISPEDFTTTTELLFSTSGYLNVIPKYEQREMLSNTRPITHA